MAKKRNPVNQLIPVKRDKLPEYGELVNLMQTETASIITDYIRQWIGVMTSTPEPGHGIFINWDRVLRAQTYQELAWYDLYAEVEKDTHVAAVLTNAKLNVAGMRWDVSAFKNLNEEEPSARNNAIAQFVKHVLDDIGYFPQHLYNLLDAIGKGFSVSEIIWEVGKDGVVVKDILNRPQRRFQFDAVDRSLRLRDITQPYYGTPLPDKKFIVHRASSTWENPFGDALDQSIYWMWLFKKTVMKFWMQHLQVGASSIPIVKHPAAANKEMKAEALSIAEMIRNGAYGRIPDNFEIQFAEAKNASQNADAYNQFIRMADDQIAKCVNGQTLTSESSSSTGTGTQALGSVHEDTQSARDEFRAHGLEATLNQTLIKWLVDFNFANVDGYPQFRFDMEAEENLELEARIVQTLSSAGYDFDEAELSDKFNYTLTKKEPLQLGGGSPFGKPKTEEPEEEEETEEDVTPEDKEAKEMADMTHKHTAEFLKMFAEKLEFDERESQDRMGRLEKALITLAERQSSREMLEQAILKIAGRDPVINVSAPEVNVHPPIIRAPNVEFNQKSPEIHVHVPEQKPPTINVTIEDNPKELSIERDTMGWVKKAILKTVGKK